jgi:hypothetical protein
MGYEGVESIDMAKNLVQVLFCEHCHKYSVDFLGQMSDYKLLKKDCTPQQLIQISELHLYSYKYWMYATSVRPRHSLCSHPYGRKVPVCSTRSPVW